MIKNAFRAGKNEAGGSIKLHGKDMTGMYDEEWNRFMQTGQICDYLAYKKLPPMKSDIGKSEDIRKFEYAGISNINRDSNKIRADRRI